MSKIGLQSRSLALRILQEAKNKFGKELLDEHLCQSSLSGKDRNLVTELVQGIIRRHKTLDALIQTYSKHEPEDIVRTVLWLGLYQLLFMDKIPSYAACNTSLELLQEKRMFHAKGYVHAILQRVFREARLCTKVTEQSCTLPIDEAKAWLFPKPVFPDPKENQVAYWSAVYSCPEALAQAWQQAFGEAVARQLLIAMNQSPSLYLRPRIPLQTAIAEWNSFKIPVEVTQHGLLKLPHGVDFSEFTSRIQNRYQIIGHFAFQVVQMMNPQPNTKILDICAAPGTKTMAIADAMQGTGQIIACDISQPRLQLLRQIMETYGNSITIQEQDATQIPSAWYGQFDQVLADVPCSNSAVFAKRPDARWRFNKTNLLALQQIQSTILAQAALALRHDGILIYSTCSIEAEENQDVIQKFLKIYPNFGIIEEKRELPLLPYCDGGSAFKLKKINK